MTPFRVCYNYSSCTRDLCFFNQYKWFKATEEQINQNFQTRATGL